MIRSQANGDVAVVGGDPALFVHQAADANYVLAMLLLSSGHLYRLEIFTFGVNHCIEILPASGAVSDLQVLGASSSWYVINSRHGHMETEQDRVSRILQQQLQLALQRRKRASIVLAEVCDDHEGMPSADGTERIRNASRELSAALEALTLAVKRCTDYLLTKVPPDDLKSES